RRRGDAARPGGAGARPSSSGPMPDSRPRSVPRATGLAVTLQEDRPGMLAKAAEAIASGGLNLDGFAELEGILHMVTSDARSARLALEAVGLPVVGEREVIVVKVEHRVGAAAGFFGQLALGGLNVGCA